MCICLFLCAARVALSCQSLSQLHDLVRGADACSLLSCPCCDLSELAVLFFSHRATEPAVLRLMSKHSRLGVPLPAKDAHRVSVLLSTMAQVCCVAVLGW